MKLLKLGRLESPTGRWKDALEFFTQITVVKLFRGENEDPALSYLNIRSNLFLSLLSRISFCLNERRWAKWVCDFAFFLLRYPATIYIRPLLKKCDYDAVHVSYNDYDESAFLLALLYPFLRKDIPIIRAYKETRPEWKYLERKSFILSDRIVLNERENANFFENKYGSNIFEGKIVLTGLDEDAIGEAYISKVRYAEKLSSKDKRKHMVILCSRAFSDTSDVRSGSRLYYVDMIKEFLAAGFVVHLHTLNIFPDKNGINQYEILRKKYGDSFYIEKPLNFDEEHFAESYQILSRYDYGVLHNFVEGTPNTEFDKYNIPHRYYEYELAHVTPILLKGKTIVMERLLEENNTGVVYSKPEDVNLCNKCDYKISAFSDYIKSIYINPKPHIYNGHK